MYDIIFYFHCRLVSTCYLERFVINIIKKDLFEFDRAAKVSIYMCEPEAGKGVFASRNGTR